MGDSISKDKAINSVIANPEISRLIEKNIFQRFLESTPATTPCPQCYATTPSTTTNPSIYNILCWFAGPMGQTNRRPSVWCSKYFFSIVSYRLRALKTLYFYFCNFIKKYKNKLKWFLQRIMQDFMKKKLYLEHQTLGPWFVCPIGPANQRIKL